MEPDRISRLRKIHPRYRLRPPEYKFRFDGQRRWTETTTGLPVYCTATSNVFGQDPVPPERRPSYRIYLTAEGEPATPYDEQWLRRDMTNYLCVLKCRWCPEDQDLACNESGGTDYECILSAMGMPERLPPLTPGGYSAADLDRLRVGRLETVEQRTRRSFIEMAPAEWRRAVIKRLSLFFLRPKSDLLIQRLGDYFCRRRDWHAWAWDHELRPLSDEMRSDPQLDRLLSIMFRFTFLRVQVSYGRKVKQEPVRMSARNRRGKFVFCFPSPLGRRGRALARDEAIRKIIWRTIPCLLTGPYFENRWIAAAVFVGRDFLEKPRALARLELTQEVVASHFGLTRRQLAYAIRRIKDPKFTEPFWRDQAFRRNRSR